MVRFSVLAFVASAFLCTLGFAASASTKRDDGCGVLAHPDLDCSEPWTCEKNWPSETGNYGTPVEKRDLSTLDAVDKNTTRVIDYRPLLQHLELAAASRASQLTSSTSSLPTTTFRTLPARSEVTIVPVPQCCRLTVECFNFWLDDLKIDRIENDGRFVIDDLQQWKMAECCWADFVRWKDWCENPPKRTDVFDFQRPPLCVRMFS